MNDLLWLRAADCPLLQTNPERLDLTALRQTQRLLELCLTRLGTEDLVGVALEEIGQALSADRAVVAEPSPEWRPRWQWARRGLRSVPEPLPGGLLGEALDREAAVARPPVPGQPALLAARLTSADRANRALVVVRPREPFTSAELEYGVAAAHYLGGALDRARAWDELTEHCERLQALVAIGQQLVEERETVPLLEHIAEQATRLLRCERASIFLWDPSRNELVGRPALGLPGGELRLPDTAGVVGRTVQTGHVQQVDDVRADPSWNPEIDSASGFRTRNLLCVPLVDGGGARLGAFEVMNKQGGPFTPGDVQTLQALAAQTTAAVQSVREREALLRSNAQLEGQARLGARIVGCSAKMQGLRSTIEGVARTNLSVLILGESGTGKDVVARAIHYSSPREKQPYIPVNCAAIAETLIESELFGHEKGAFTGADATRAGKFEAASGGTLFLDEVGELSAGGQAKLLRVLEEKVVYRVGGAQPIPVDVRVIAATNRDLAEQVRAGKFREDLFYRLSVVTLGLPPLRERREDILVLAEHFLEQFCRDAARRPAKLSAEARKRLEQHDWPGNVRELRNLLERVAYLCPGDKVEASDLAFILRPAAKEDEDDLYAGMGLSDATEVFEREFIKKAIEKAGRNMSEAAKLLGLHRPNLYRKMKLLKMNL
jgi:transcriptional regulator with GAF, ATPase, and Fis domain